MLNFAARTSSTIASAILYAILVSAAIFIETPEESIFPWLAAFMIIWIMVGDLLVQHKKAHPPYSERIFNNKIDIDWGFKYLYWAAWWPRIIG